MKQRVITGFVMSLILIPIFYFGGWFLFGTSCILGYIAGYELVKMHSSAHNLSKKYQFIIPLFSVLIIVIASLSIFYPNIFNIGDIIFTIIGIFTLLLIVSLFNKELKVTDLLIYFGFILYSGLGLFLAFRLRYLDQINNFWEINQFKYYGLTLFTYVILTTIFTDMGAYNFGLLFGKHKLCPSISPKKTIEGSIGGTLTGAIVGTIFLTIMENFISFQLLSIENIFLKIFVYFIISVLLTIFAQFGDLVASRLKREYNIKDYGFIFPGHGGVMDRFDSLIVTGTTFYLILAIIGVVL